MTLSPAFSALAADLEPGRKPTATSLTPDSLQIQRMRVPLAAIADDGDLLALDQIEIGIPIVIDAHANFPYPTVCS